MSASGRTREIDELLVAALSVGMSYEAAARSVGCSSRTVRRRMSDLEFRGRVADGRREEVDRVRAELCAAAPSALATLVELAANAEAESARVNAAKAILAQAIGRDRSPTFDTFAYSDVLGLLKNLVDEALRRLPEEHQEPFLLTAQALCRGL